MTISTQPSNTELLARAVSAYIATPTIPNRIADLFEDDNGMPDCPTNEDAAALKHRIDTAAPHEIPALISDHASHLIAMMRLYQTTLPDQRGPLAHRIDNLCETINLC